MGLSPLDWRHSLCSCSRCSLHDWVAATQTADANDIGPAHDDVSVENRAESADSIERGRVSGDGDGLGVDSGTDHRSGSVPGGGAVTDDLDTADEHVVKTD